ncbi:Lar family restriction alleviation protein [Oxalobacter aliiformigenes]|uniref:Lar family restriction alleviation protein n=1 Tax=Oxalobacter aliiformigenes TaxID=2946593 RepID=UPI0022B03C98|nr:Lar family restriction alleviation protein [Oxalobacter aliiformigenes]MCZ4064087.1 Lar family restriction alleviation protein [Oxalobacter aliiformigenes]WAV99464.1 Lar family restriction alleviation protein [Oxalobacter aliiformigenes]
MSEKLLPCPFCDCSAKMIVDQFGHDETCCIISCVNCHGRISVYDADENDAKERAINIWNNRVYPPEISEAINHSIARKPMHQRNLFGEIKLGDCPACTAPVNEEFRFCGDCGQKLDWSE